MGRKPKIPAVDVQGLWETSLRNVNRRDYFKLMENFTFVESAENQGEVELPISALYRLQLMFKRMNEPRFDGDAWNRYLQSFSDGVVTVPVYWLKAILDAFEEYRFGDDQPTLDQAFGAARTETHDTARATIENLEHYARLAALIQAERTKALIKGEIISLEEAKARVQEIFEGEPIAVSERTLDRAWARWGDHIERVNAVLAVRQ